MGVFPCGAPSPRMTYRRRRDRSVDELIGICRGFLADGAIVKQEAEFLLDWVERHAEFGSEFPFNVLYQRLHDALADGVLDNEEEADLLDCVVKLVGGETASCDVTSLSTALPLNDPPPQVTFPEHFFVVTGTFSYGARRLVCQAIEDRGGEVKTSVSRQIAYLVVGAVGSRDWIHSSYGRKIEAAVALRQEGLPIAIISEHHWAGYV